MRTEMLDFIENLFRSHLSSAIEAVFGVAPNAAKITACQPHKHARHSSIGGLALERFVDFGDLHFRLWSDGRPRPSSNYGQDTRRSIPFTHCTSPLLSRFQRQ